MTYKLIKEDYYVEAFSFELRELLDGIT